MNSKILVCCHKKAKVYSDNVYMPIQVGKALHPSLELGYLTDAEGENISSRNDSFCELTAQYWAWKNLDCDYIGLCHYRRYFSQLFDDEKISNDMSNYDIILASPVTIGDSIFNFWTEHLVNEDIHIFYQYMIKRFPNLTKEIDLFFLNRTFFNPCNMFFCKKSVFDEFAKWQFSILFDLEKLILKSEYSRPRRIFGYLAEGLLSFYVYIKRLKVKTYPLVNYPGEAVLPYPNSFKDRFKYALRTYGFFKKQYKLQPDFEMSLKNADIFTKINKITEKYEL